MRKFFLLSVISLFLLSLVTSYGYSQSAEDILKKMVEVQGGKKSLENIKDSTLSGSMEFKPMAASGTIALYWKAPNKLRTEVEMMGMKFIQIYDGEKAWTINPQAGTQELPEKFAKNIKRQSIGSDLIVNPGKYGVKFTFKGKEKVKEKECFVLEQTYSDGYTATIYVDSKAYVTVKTKAKSLNQMGQEVDSEIYFSDYKKVDGKMVAHGMVQFQAGQEYMKVTFDKVSYDSGLDDSLFKAPQ
jgi:outer membrane lipoprotein-sorting protein